MPIGLIGELGLEMEDVLDGDSECGMPSEWVIQMLEHGLSNAGVADFTVVEAEIYELTPGGASEVVDHMVKGSEYPYILVGDHVVCVGGLDLEAVLGAVTSLKS